MAISASSARSETKTAWHEIDPATLSPECVKAYQAYKSQYAAAKVVREKFEETMRKSVELPDGQRLAISYHYGKLSVASVTDEGERKATSKKAVSLLAAFG